MGKSDPQHHQPSRGLLLRSHPERRGAFTLLEVLVTLAVIGALAVGVGLSVRAASAGAELRRASENLEVFTASAKAQAAVSASPMTLTLRPGESAVVLRRIGADDFELAHELPGGVAIDAVRMAGATQRDRPLRLTIQPSGYVRRFAVRLSQGERRLWVRWDPAAASGGWEAMAPSEAPW